MADPSADETADEREHAHQTRADPDPPGGLGGRGGSALVGGRELRGAADPSRHPGQNVRLRRQPGRAAPDRHCLRADGRSVADLPLHSVRIGHVGDCRERGGPCHPRLVAEPHRRGQLDDQRCVVGTGRNPRGASRRGVAGASNLAAAASHCECGRREYELVSRDIGRRPPAGHHAGRSTAIRPCLRDRFRSRPGITVCSYHPGDRRSRPATAAAKLLARAFTACAPGQNQGQAVSARPGRDAGSDLVRATRGVGQRGGLYSNWCDSVA